MKFVVSSTALLNVLQTSNKVVSNKNTLPILDNFLFELKDGVLKITLPRAEARKELPKANPNLIDIE